MARQGKFQADRVGSVNIEKIGAVWHVRYTGPDGRRVRRSLKVTNREVAEKKARQYSDMLERGDDAGLSQRLDRKRVTWREFMVEFAAGYTRWRESTRAGNASHLMALDRAWGDLLLSGISARRIEAYLAAVRDQGRTTATVNRHLATIKTILRTAQRWGYLTHNPADAVRMNPEMKRPPKGFHDAELAALLDHLDGDRRDAVAFLADTGLRWSEFQRLAWPDVHLADGYLLAGQKNYEVRTVPLSERVRAMLAPRAAKRGPVWELTYQMLRRSLDNAGRASGLGHVHLHMLRHTFATRLLDQGVPLNDVQALMGHKTPMMTQRYDHVHPDRLHRAVRALDPDKE